MMIRHINQVRVATSSVDLYGMQSIRNFLTDEILDPVFCQFILDKYDLFFLSMPSNCSQTFDRKPALVSFPIDASPNSFWRKLA